MKYYSRIGPAILVALSWPLTAEVRATDWPQWRGPNRDNVWSETGIMESFPKDGGTRLVKSGGGPRAGLPDGHAVG